MRLYLAILAVLVCASCGPAARGNHLRPPPLRPGHGAPTYDPHVRQPQPERSPHKRPLPSTKEKGLWASHPSDDTSLRPLLLGVELPYPPTAASEAERETTLLCAAIMGEMAMRPSVPDAATGLWPEAARRCAAARLYVKCVEGLESRSRRQARAAILVDKEHEKRLRATRENAERFQAAACQGMTLPPEAEGFVRATGQAWEAEVSR